MMKIYIPSRARFQSKYFTSAYTPMRWLNTPELKARAVYVVRDDEHRNYAHALRDWDVEVLPCGDPPNLSKKRQWIAEYAWSKGEKTFAMSDDDVMLYIRKGPDQFNLRYPLPWEVEKLLLEQIPDLLKEYAQVGVSAREGNNRPGPGEFPMIHECTRSMRFFAFRTEDYLSVDANRLSEMADFDTTLQLLRKGLKNAVLFYWAQGQPGTQIPGGCAVYRTHETHEAVAHRLKAYHPDFVNLVQKKKKSGGEFGTRTEVMIQWKKAYESSKKVEAKDAVAA
jgi:hypothetical protein